MMCAKNFKVNSQLTNPRHMDREKKRGEYEKVKCNLNWRLHFDFCLQATQILAVRNRVSTSHLRSHWSLDFTLLNCLCTSDEPVSGHSPLELHEAKLFTATEGDLNVLCPYLKYVVQVFIKHILPWKHVYAPYPPGGPYNTLPRAQAVQAIDQVGKRGGCLCSGKFT